jgi:hypothetical protein
MVQDPASAKGTSFRCSYTRFYHVHASTMYTNPVHMRFAVIRTPVLPGFLLYRINKALTNKMHKLVNRYLKAILRIGPKVTISNVALWNEFNVLLHLRKCNCPTTTGSVQVLATPLRSGRVSMSRLHMDMDDWNKTMDTS